MNSQTQNNPYQINLSTPTQPTPQPVTQTVSQPVPQTSTPQQPSQTKGSAYDAQAVALTKAIRQQESGGNYKAKGDAGTSTGAFQFQPETWKKYAQEVLGNANAPETPANQDAVAYVKVKNWKDQGLNPAQIAAAWNAGEQKALSGDWTKNVGTTEINGKKIEYNTPQYVKNVIDLYHKYGSAQPATQTQEGYQTTPAQSGQQTTQPDNQFGYQTQPATPTMTPEQTKAVQAQNAAQKQQEAGSWWNPVGDVTGTASSIANRAQSIAKNVSDMFQPGDSSWWDNFLRIGSDELQAGGQVAGGLGDLVNGALKLIPGVGKAENWAGGEVAKAADTKVGKAVVGQLQDFQKTHPMLSKDIGAGVNILSAIPILKGIGAVKDVAMAGLGKALEGRASNALADGIASSIVKTAPKTGARLIDKLGGTQGIQDVIKEGFLPDIKKEGGNIVWDTQAALDKAQAAGRKINNSELEPLLKKGSGNPQSDSFSLSALQKKAEQNAIENQQASLIPQIKTEFDNIRAKYGSDTLNPQQINNAKRTLSSKIPDKKFQQQLFDANLTTRHTLQKAIEDWANYNNLGDVQAINQKMSHLYDIQDLLDYLGRGGGKKVPIGKTGRLLKTLSFPSQAAVGALGLQTGGILPGIIGYGGTKALEGGLETIPTQLSAAALEKGKNLPGLFGKALKKGSKGAAALAAQQNTKP